MSLKYTLALKFLTDESFVLGSARNIHPSCKLFLGKNMLTLDVPCELLGHSQIK